MISKCLIFSVYSFVMIDLNINFHHDEYGDDKLNASIRLILGKNELMSMASVKNEKSWINTAYYCFDERLNFYFLSDPSTEHVKNIKENDSVALSIFDSSQKWDDNKKGLQIFGRCHKAKLNELPLAIKLYSDRFASFGQLIKNPGDFARNVLTSRFYVIYTDSLKLFDETNFGEEESIELVPKP